MFFVSLVIILRVGAIEEVLYDSEDRLILWSKIVPSKVNFFALCEGLNQIASKDI